MFTRATYWIVLLAVGAGSFLAGTSHSPHSAVAAADGVPGHDHHAMMNHAARPDGAVSITPRQQQLGGVTVAAAAASTDVARVRLFGRVSALETATYRLFAGLDGYVRDVSPLTIGSAVRKGQWLATFGMPEARQPISAFITTLDVLDRETKLQTGATQLGLANASVGIAVDRLMSLGLSQTQIDEIRRTRVVPSEIRISSPVDGFVLSRNVGIGETLDRGAETFRIADLRRVWILADVPAAEAALVKPGAAVQVSAAGVPVRARARITRDILPQFDAMTQSFKLRIEADNTGFALRPDMFVDVDLDVAGAGSLTVPATAIVATGTRYGVFVESAAGVFEPRFVELGRRLGDRVTVVKGLAAGERIAVSGTFLLDSESRMMSHGQPHH
jgi:membrane fusion protein, copper/silver efflux system